jgi:hypothetical protein
MSVKSRCKTIMVILRQAQISTAKINCLFVARGEVIIDMHIVPITES